MNIQAMKAALEEPVLIHYPTCGRGKHFALRTGKIVDNDDTRSTDGYGFALSGLEMTVTADSAGQTRGYVLWHVGSPTVCNLWIGPVEILTEYVVTEDEEETNE